MLNIPDKYLDLLLMPVCAAQLFIAVFIYIFIVRKRIAAEFKFYLRFLACFIFFLVTRPIQEFTTPFIYGLTLYVRVFILFVIAAPALISAAFSHVGFSIHRTARWLLYLVSVIIFLSYSIIHGINESDPQLFFGLTREIVWWIPDSFTKYTAHQIQLVGTVLFFVLPFCYLLFYQFRMRRAKSTQTTFCVGIILFGLFMSASVVLRNFTYTYYGSFISGCIWIWAIFHDVRDMKGKVALLKEELLLQVKSGDTTEKLSDLLKELEAASHGNLEVYKVQVREILLMLADTGIAAGGDPQMFIERSDELEQQVKASSDVQDIQKIVNKEAVEVSAMIADAPNAAIEQAIAYIGEHYARDLSVEEIAEAQNLSKYYFMRLFKKETGQTVNQYVKELRMEKAKELLKTKSITDTAFDVGYNDSNYFGTVFKKHTGMTPSQYQQKDS